MPTPARPSKTRDQEDGADDDNGHDGRGERPTQDPVGEKRELESGQLSPHDQLQEVPPGNKGRRARRGMWHP